VISAPEPRNEEGRLQALFDLVADDPIACPHLDAIVQAAAEQTGSPMAKLSLVGLHRQVFVARFGLSVASTPRDIAFCAHAICEEGPFMVRDAALDDRFWDNPLVRGEPHIRGYLGVPLRLYGLYGIGALCVVDRVPRQWSARDISTLERLAKDALRTLVDRRAERLLKSLTS
jgi:GAF domain-containing protein